MFYMLWLLEFFLESQLSSFRIHHERDKYSMISFICGIYWKGQIIEPEGRSVVAWGRGLREMGRCWSRHTLSGRRFTFLLFTQSCPTLRPHGLQHARLPRPSPSPGACSNSCPVSRWCHPTISSSVVLFSSCPQFFPASGSFLMSWLS